jgi:hypothetical protein
MDLYRIYTNAAYDSWLDLCLHPEPQAALGPGTWGGSVISSGIEYCPNCPLGPFLDYSNLKYDETLFDLPCRTNFSGAITVNGNSLKGTMPSNYCYVSLGHTFDARYNFNVQFPSYLQHDPPNWCASPFLCPPEPDATTGRHLLQTLFATPGLRSGTGSK